MEKLFVVESGAHATLVGLFRFSSWPILHSKYLFFLPLLTGHCFVEMNVCHPAPFKWKNSVWFYSCLCVSHCLHTFPQRQFECSNDLHDTTKKKTIQYTKSRGKKDACVRLHSMRIRMGIALRALAWIVIRKIPTTSTAPPSNDGSIHNFVTITFFRHCRCYCCYHMVVNWGQAPIWHQTISLYECTSKGAQSSRCIFMPSCQKIGREITFWESLTRSITSSLLECISFSVQNKQANIHPAEKPTLAWSGRYINWIGADLKWTFGIDLHWEAFRCNINHGCQFDSIESHCIASESHFKTQSTPSLSTPKNSSFLLILFASHFSY